MSLMLGVAKLYWMYRDFDFRMVQHTLLHEMNWWWMLASFPVKTISKYKHLNKNIHEKEYELGARRHPTIGAHHGLLRHNIRLDSM